MQKKLLQIELKRLVDDPTTKLVDAPRPGISMQGWSKAAGRSETYVRDLIRDPKSNPSAENLKGLAIAIGLRPTYFMELGEASPPGLDTNSRRRDPSIEGRKLDESFSRIQSATDSFEAIGYVSSRPDGEWGDYEVEKETAAPQTRRLLRIETDRMSPRYLVGETVALEHAAPKDGDHIWIEMKPGPGTNARPAMLRLLKEQDSTTLTLVQYTPRKTMTIERRRVSEIYRVLSSDDFLSLLGARLRPQ